MKNDNIDIVGVTGSIPVSPTILKLLKYISNFGKREVIISNSLVVICSFLGQFGRVLRYFLANIRPTHWSVTIKSVLLSVSIVAAVTSPCIAASPPGYWVTVERVVDGDTFWAEGIKYRLKDIDTPETSSDPRHGYKCEAERRLGELATAEGEAILLNRKVWIKPSGADDRYGRKLVKVRFAYGKWYGEHMIKSRLAARWQGRKHKWCETLD